MKPAKRGGFTMTELVMVMVIVGVLAAVMLPRLTNPGDSEGMAYADGIVATLRLAQKSAVARRRVVCVKAEPAAFTLAVAKTNPAPAAGCEAALAGQAGATSADATVRAASASVPSLLGRTLYFQPNGDITTDLGGATPAAGTITVSTAAGKVRDITVEGATGHVDYATP